uniref:Uncharacterized protein n=1 Tax=Periophthalmus magnuspinnatus TaxID=409849 RepID=A0A3B4BAS0_9GOBI
WEGRSLSLQYYLYLVTFHHSPDQSKSACFSLKSYIVHLYPYFHFVLLKLALETAAGDLTSVVNDFNSQDWRHLQNRDEGFVHRRQWERGHAMTTCYFTDVHCTVTWTETSLSLNIYRKTQLKGAHVYEKNKMSLTELTGSQNVLIAAASRLNLHTDTEAAFGQSVEV